MQFERHHTALIVASLITVASFMGATAYTQNRLVRVDDVSTRLERNAIPSLEYLSRAAVRLTRLNQVLNDATADQAARARALRTAQAEVITAGREIAQYQNLPPLPGEAELGERLRADVDRAMTLVRMSIDEQEAVPGAAPDERGRTTLSDALEQAVRSILAALDFDVHASEEMARDVMEVRRSTRRMIIQLDAIAAGIALVAVVIAYRASRRHDQLEHEHSVLLGARVEELDRFAGRVAHDVLSPLGAVSAGLGLIARSPDAQARNYAERSQRALGRVHQLVAGLLAFARSGARPDPTARCRVDTALATAVADCADAAAEQHVDLVVGPCPPIEVPCTSAVMTSMLENLVRNAIKYMGDRPVRRVVVRARAVRRDKVRIEVQDTGPGVPSELQATLFEPFVRGQHEVGGTGLGLATVKRLAESHGGSAGLESTPGSGSLFWIELPLVHSDQPA
jgi:signal transduction histidine kinase